jgi:superoxide reductase
MAEIENLGNLILTFDNAAGEALGKRESHTPKIEVPGRIKADEAFEIKVSVGPHPNTVEHSIRWIEIYYYEKGRGFNPISLYRAEFAPVLSEPAATIRAKMQKEGEIHAMEYYATCTACGPARGRSRSDRKASG